MLPKSAPSTPTNGTATKTSSFSDGRMKEQVVEHQRTGATPLHVLCGPLFHGQHEPQLERTWCAHEMDQTLKLLPLESSQAPPAPTLP